MNMNLDFIKKPIRTTFHFICRSPWLFGKILLADVFFLLSIYLLWQFEQKLEPFISSLLPANLLFRIMFLIIITFFATSLLILLYSLFTFYQIRLIDKIVLAHRNLSLNLSPNHFLGFLKLHYLSLLPFLLILLTYVFAAGYYLTERDFSKITSPFQLIGPFLIFAIVALILAFFVYHAAKTTQSYFLSEKGSALSFLKMLKFWFKPKSLDVYWTDGIILLFLGMIILFMDTTFTFLTKNNLLRYLNYYGVYKNALVVTVAVASYFLIIVNRLWFYIMGRDNCFDDNFNDNPIKNIKIVKIVPLI